MVKISPDEILRKHGRWINREQWLDLVARERKVGTRQAWNIIKKEAKDAIKHVYTDRSTVYGLPEFGPPISKTEKGFHHFGFFQWLEKRAVRKEHEEKEMQKMALLDLIHYEESLVEAYPKTFGFMKEHAEQDRETLRMLEQNSSKIEEKKE